jgi:tetratricopeptide (TPR) repeat protein
MGSFRSLLARTTRIQRIEILALPVLAGAAVILWTAPLRAERALKNASFNELRAISRRDPDNPRVFYHLGARLRDLGQLGPATAAFARAAILDPESEEIWLAWGTTASTFGRSDDAFQALSKCAESHPKSKRAHLALALFCHEHFALQRAYDEALAAGRCDPSEASAWRLAGVTALELRDVPGAEAALTKAAALAPKDWRTQLALGRALAANHRPEEARTCYQHAAELAPAEAEVLLALGQMQLQLSKNAAETEIARATLQKASELNPASSEALTALGQALSRLERWPDARVSLRAAVQQKPNSAVAHFELARVLRQLGDNAAADRETLAHAKIKEYEEARLSLGSRARTSNDPAVRLKLARLCASHGDFGEAILAYRNLLSHGPGQSEAVAKAELARLERDHPQLPSSGEQPASPSPSSVSGSSIALLLKDAASVLARGKFPEAERAYLQIVRADPKSAKAFEGMGLAMVGQGKTEEAFRALDRALKLDARLPEAQFALARLYYDQGFIDEAARRMEVLTKQVPGNAAYLHALAVCILEDSSRYLQTEQVLERAIALDPKQMGFWRDLARTEANLNKLDRAEECYRKALALEPGRVDSAVNLATFLLDHRPGGERQNEAERLLREAAAKDPNSAEAQLGLGRIGLAKGDVKGAVNRLQQAVSRDPNLAPGWYHLSRAYDRAGDVVRAQDCRAAFRDITNYRKELSETEELARYDLKNPKLRLKLARLYARGGQNARAINQYQVCLSLDGNSASTRKELESFTGGLQSQGKLPSMSALNGMLLASMKGR